MLDADAMIVAADAASLAIVGRSTSATDGGGPQGRRG
jgi:hypothetical protein